MSSWKDENIFRTGLGIKRRASQFMALKFGMEENFSSTMPAYCYTSLCRVPHLQEPPEHRKPEHWECPRCRWDSTNDDRMENAIVRPYRSGNPEGGWNAITEWKCPVCGCTFETWEGD